MDSPIEYQQYPQAQSYYQQPQVEFISNIRDLEEKLRLLKDRILLVGQTQIEEREKTFKEIQDLKKTVLQLKDENTRIKELLKRLAEQANNMARKEELAIIQRQLDLMRD